MVMRSFSAGSALVEQVGQGQAQPARRPGYNTRRVCRGTGEQLSISEPWPHHQTRCSNLDSLAMTVCSHVGGKTGEMCSRRGNAGMSELESGWPGPAKPRALLTEAKELAAEGRDGLVEHVQKSRAGAPFG